jgi:hypothetical protein
MFGKLKQQRRIATRLWLKSFVKTAWNMLDLKVNISNYYFRRIK